jgi:hypothetical protein
LDERPRLGWRFVAVGFGDVGVVKRGFSILRALSLLLLLALGQFNEGEPFIRQGRNKIGIIIVRFEAVEIEEVGPRCWGFRGASVNGFEQVVVDNMELRANVIRTKVTNEAHCAGAQRRCIHVLSLTRPRLPFGYLFSILEPRLKHVDGATPGVSVHEGTERRLGLTPDLMRGEARSLTGKFIVKGDGMAKTSGQRSQ